MVDWQWNHDRARYYFYDVVRDRYIFENNEIVDIARNTEAAFTSSYSISSAEPESASTVWNQAAGPQSCRVLNTKEFSISDGPRTWYESLQLFRSSSENLYYLDPTKDYISLLVCQHVIRKCRGSCLAASLWPHEHLNDTEENPSVALYVNRGTSVQTMVIDIGSACVTSRQLKTSLIQATRNYREYMMRRMAGRINYSAAWETFHATEMKHYKWAPVSSTPRPAGTIYGNFHVSGVICSSCKAWTRLGSYCVRCPSPTQDEASFNVESDLEIAEGAVGGLVVAATAGSFLFLNLLLML